MVPCDTKNVFLDWSIVKDSLEWWSTFSKGDIKLYYFRGLCHFESTMLVGKSRGDMTCAAEEKKKKS